MVTPPIENPEDADAAVLVAATVVEVGNGLLASMVAVGVEPNFKTKPRGM